MCKNPNFVTFDNLKKQPSKLGYFSKIAEIFSTAKKARSTQNLKTHIAFSIFPILCAYKSLDISVHTITYFFMIQESRYDLVGVICHHGTAGGGHYTSYGLNNGDQEWYEYDDSYVSKVIEKFWLNF